MSRRKAEKNKFTAFSVGPVKQRSKRVGFHGIWSNAQRCIRVFYETPVNTGVLSICTRPLRSKCFLMAAGGMQKAGETSGCLHKKVLKGSQNPDILMNKRLLGGVRLFRTDG